MEKQELLYEGKAKRVYRTELENQVWIEYKDSATAFNGEKKEEIVGKGILNNQITSLIFSYLNEQGIESHFVKKISDHEQLVEKVEIIPLEVVVRSYAAGSMSKRLGIEEGTLLKRPLVEFYLKNDDLGDPILTEDHIDVMELATKEEVQILKEKALKVRIVLTKLFDEVGVDLIDFKLEFGKKTDGSILLADEISPDTCRLWDQKTKEKLDKDVFRRGLGSLTNAYDKILERLGGKVK
jgi:phosphoribosylaminoimidazole-succinocarboxamide synthase